MDSSKPRPLIDGLDTVTSWLERPVRRLSGSDRFNPLPHAGTISVFLLAVVIVSGLYITLFFQYGYEASYESVLRMEQHPIQRVMRALHRYSSAALVVTTLVHGWRIFVAGRFTPRRRRWRWLTGVVSLLVLWPAGVTGYLLVWDERAGAVAAAIAKSISFTGVGVAWSVRHLIGPPRSSGAVFMVVVWFLHLGLTAVVGYFVFRHLRRSNLAWYPARHWMLVMGGALVASSLLLPLGMLGPADGESIGFDLPLDPFVLFLLPVLESSSRWIALAALTAIAGLVAGLSFLLRRGAPEPVRISTEACTGCNLCVVDCPYGALSLVAADPTGANRHDSMVAVVDASNCTSCGICLGSCAFDAMALARSTTGLMTGGAGATVKTGGAGGKRPDDQDLDGRSVVIACDRHRAAGSRLTSTVSDGPEAALQFVRCAGIVGSDLIRDLSEQGAGQIDIVGCAIDDCRYGVGNTLAEQRLIGDRAPQVPRAFRSNVDRVWVAPGEVGSAGSGKALGQHRAELLEEAGTEGQTRRALVGSSALVVASALVISLATAAPFSNPSADAAISVIVDQEIGLGLVDNESFTDEIESVEAIVDGVSLGSRATTRWRGAVVASAEWSVQPGRRDVEVVASGRSDSFTVFAADSDLEANRRLVIPVRSQALAPVAEAGREVFFSRQGGCSVCHSIAAGDDGVGPSLFDVAGQAATRVEGLDAETYLWQSILLPDEYVVEGYPAGQMLPIYRERLSQEELNALVAYLLTLTGDAGDSGSMEEKETDDD